MLAERDRIRTLVSEELMAFRKLASTPGPNAWHSFFEAGKYDDSAQAQFRAVLAYWRMNKESFNILRIIAAQLFSVRITSASVERMFSFAGLVRTARRNRMSADTFDALVAYAYNDTILQSYRRSAQQTRSNKMAEKH